LGNTFFVNKKMCTSGDTSPSIGTNYKVISAGPLSFTLIYICIVLLYKYKQQCLVRNSFFTGFKTALPFCKVEIGENEVNSCIAPILSRRDEVWAVTACFHINLWIF
jgi:hypothetical protein